MATMTAGASARPLIRASKIRSRSEYASARFQTPARRSVSVMAPLATGSSSNAASGSALADRSAIAEISIASRKWSSRRVGQRQRAAGDPQDQGRDNLPSARRMEIEALKFPDAASRSESVRYRKTCWYSRHP